MRAAAFRSDRIPRSRAASLEQPIFFLSGIIILLIFTLSSPLLNLVMAYSQPGGSFFAKFHPASWLSAPLLFLVCLDQPEKARSLPRHLIGALALIALIIAWLAARHKGALASTFIDIHLTPTVLLLALARLPLERVRVLLRLFIALAAINVFIVFAEFAAQTHLVPIEEARGEYFRPFGLFAHPIQAGTLFYCAMFLAASGVVSSGVARPLMLLLLFGVALCGVRGPLAMAGLVFVSHVIHPAYPRRYLTDYLFDFGLIVLLPIGILAALSLGAFDRIMALGIWEESAQSRFYIFDALDLLNQNQFWHGVDGYDVGDWLAKQATGDTLIENAFVVVIFQAGLPAAVMLGIFLFVLHAPAMLRSLLFSMMVVLVLATTTGFGTKNLIAAAMALTGYWTWRQAMERRRQPFTNLSPPHLLAKTAERHRLYSGRQRPLPVRRSSRT